ncbi:hypothetical protein [Taklimakanibacter lacteus]|uniref:hypothetical protein n=1 Tax=Taklimakanibacter lacteus TaxID=2268456 RepID=UPI000E66E5B4
MRPQALFIESDDGPPPEPILRQIEAGRLRLVRQVDLKPADLDAADGLVATIYLDQIDFDMRRSMIAGFLARGGRIVLNGHVVRPFIDGMQPFVPLATQRRSDLVLQRLAPHPVFAGIAAEVHQTQKGVAGFYGRGHNPPLPGATLLTGIGPERRPIDWEWLAPGGGGLFVHSGNDIWGAADQAGVDVLIAERIVDWALAGRNAEVAA